MGTAQSVGAAARIVGPMSAGWLFEHIRHGAPFLGAAVLFACAAVVAATVRLPPHPR